MSRTIWPQPRNTPPSQRLFFSSTRYKENTASDSNVITTALHRDQMPTAFDATDLSGAFFGTPLFVAVAVAPEGKQLADPHSYPEGQHPGATPSSLPHKNQPPAHDLPSAVDVLSAGPGAGTTTVTPPDTNVVAGGGGGHEYVWQSRSVRQHPPWWTARHP